MGTLGPVELLVLLFVFGFFVAMVYALVTLVRSGNTTDNNEELTLMVDMTDSQRMLFQTQMLASRKSPTAGVLLALFLGGFGAHHFYLGQIGVGVLYVLFIWTFIPGIISFFEVFLMAGRVRRFNLQKAQLAAAQIKSLRSNAATA